MTQPLSDHEMDQLVALLRQFATHDLDQHDAWKLSTPYGSVYVNFSRVLPAGHHDEAYRTLPVGVPQTRQGD